MVTNIKEYPKVIALILTYNDSETVLNCIDSVRASDYPNYDVFLIDNKK